MPMMRFVSAFGIVFSMSIFFFLNIRTLDGGGGMLFVLVAILSFGILLVLSGDLLRLMMVKKSSIAMMAFLFYFTAKYGFEADAYEFRQVTVGTTGGLIFSFLLGFISAYAISVIYDFQNNSTTASITTIVGMIYLVAVLAMALSSLQTHLGEIRGDILLIDEAVDYQRPADFMIIQFAVLTAMAFVLSSSRKAGSVIASLPMLVLLAGICACFVYTSQIIGSNKGLVVNAGLLLSYFICRHVAKGGRAVNRNIGLFSILFTGFGTRLLVGGLFGIFLLSGLGFVLIKKAGIDISSLRITGFGTGELSSVEGRIEVAGYFQQHFLYSPLFGNTQVEKLTTGEGTYVHSLFAILTHLGLVGFALFVVLLISIYSDITQSASARWTTVYTDRQYGLFRLMLLFIIVCMGAASAFFIWMPLWFAIAFVGEWFYRDQRASNRSPSRKKSRRRMRAPSSRHRAT